MQLLVLTIGHVVSAILLTGFGIFVLQKDPKKMQNIMFFCLAVSIAFFNAYFALGINLAPSPFSYNLWLLNIFDVFITTSYIHFMIRAIDRQVAMRWFLRATYAVAFGLLIATALFPHLFLPEITPKLYIKSYLNPGPIYTAMLAFFLTFPLVAFFELVRAYFRGGMDKLRAEYFIASSLLGYGLGPFSFLLVYNIPFDPFIGMFVGLYTLPIAYGMVSKQLLDIRVAFKRAFVYAVGISLIAALLVVFILLNNLIIAKFPYLQFWTVPLVAAFVAVVLGRAYWMQSQENERLKYEFISIATHKLRTPLTRIKWEVASALDTFKDNSAIIEAVERIEDANDHLISLTNVLVEASETDDVYYGYKKKYFDFREVLMKSLEHLKPIAEKKKIAIIEKIAQKTSLVNGDPDRIASAIDVFLENAIMYSQDNGEVEVHLEEKNKEIIFTVMDHGIGIAPEDQKHLFTRFFRSYSAKTSDTEGMGLGLSMAKSIIDKHHGAIGARSTGAGKGSTFWFSIPL